MTADSNIIYKIRLLIITLVMSAAFLVEVINTIITWDSLVNSQDGSLAILAIRMLLIFATGFGLIISTALDQLINND